MDKTDKVLLVTGASSGFGTSYLTELTLGEAVALEFHKAGYKVIAANRSLSNSGHLPAGIKVFELDSTAPPSSFDSFAKQAFDVHGHIDVVLFNAGQSIFGTVEELPSDKWRGSFEVNFWGNLKLVQALVPYLSRQEGAKLLFNSTQTHEHGFPLVGAYNTSKAALTALADTLRGELAEYKIQVTTLQAGSIRTPFTSKVAPPQTKVKSLEPVAQWIASSIGSEPLDPFKGAKRILEIVESEKPLPERYLFGQQAYSMTTDKWAKRLEEAKANEKLSIGLDTTDA